MYRLLKVKKSYFCKAVTECAESQYSSPLRTCSLCTKFYTWESSTYFRLRSYHTSLESPLRELKKKKTYRPLKTASELLSVTADRTCQRTATITKLKPKHISRLVEQPETSLDQLHRLKFPSPGKTQNRLAGKTTQNRLAGKTTRTVENVAFLENTDAAYLSEAHAKSASTPSMSEIGYPALASHGEFMEEKSSFDSALSDRLHDVSEMGDSALAMHDRDAMVEESSVDASPSERLGVEVSDPRFQDTLEEVDDSAVAEPPASSKKAEGSPPNFKVTKAEEWTSWMSKFKQLEMDYSERMHADKTRARLQILVNSGSTTKAVAMLANVKRGPRSVKFIRGAGPLYDTLLEGLAKVGDLKKTLNVIRSMDNKHVEMTLKSFSCLLECLARDKTAGNDKIIEEYMASMEQKGFKLDDIFVKMDFVRDQREMILAAIRKIKPDYNPPAFPVEINYPVPLLKDINNYGTPSYVSPARKLIHPDHMAKLVDEQVKNERSGYVQIPNIWCQETDPAVLLEARKFQVEILDQWEKNLSNGILALRNVHSQLATQSVFAYAVLKSMGVRELTKIIIQEVSLRAETSDLYSPPFSFLKRRLGQKVKEKYDLIQMTRNGVMEKRVNLYRNFCKEYVQEKETTGVKNTRHLWSRLLSEDMEGPSHVSPQPDWPPEDYLAIGSILYSCLLRDCKVNANLMTKKPPLIVPAFYTVFRTKSRRLQEELKPHPAVTQLFQAVNRKYLTMDVDMVPMVSPPVPWESFKSGGHLLRKVNLIRTTPFTDILSRHLQYSLSEKPKSHYYASYDSLNQLGSIPWKVNSKVWNVCKLLTLTGKLTDENGAIDMQAADRNLVTFNVLDVVTDVFRKGGSDELTIPFAPTANDDPAEKPISKDLNAMERSLAIKERAIARRRKGENYALWCEALYRLSLAHYYRNRVIWLPHNMDFRGRVYPVAPYLQHMSGDMARSLLCFAQGQPLGPDGLKWLKVHLVNLTGLKKRDSIADRLEFANAMLPDILDSAKNPLSGRKWWMESEKPWQTLAVCMEIEAAIESGDPASYVGHFPVHQDGSCNGLQHYAALGRDAAGAQSVNLSPMDTPQDVYSCVGEIVERNRKRDADMGIQVAKDLEGFVKRKVIKQTVMTTVYGVTRYGARLQIAKQLNAMKDFDNEKVWAASLYLTTNTFESLNEMFTSTKRIQNWLTDSAQLISQVRHECVEWVTPLGLPVTQPYSKPPSKGKKTAEVLSPTSVERPNVMKQKNAFPPNFIHSLDSTHMMLTGLHCERAGIPFVSVHDCFWVHPRNVNAMNQICREQFVALHSEPILQNLSLFLRERYGFPDAPRGSEKGTLNYMLSQVPERGSFNLEEVLKSVYFFS